MGLVERAQQEQAMKQKAAAFDAMQKEAEIQKAYQLGNGNAYAAGKMDGAAELNALMQEAAYQDGLAGQQLMPNADQGGTMPQGVNITPQEAAMLQELGMQATPQNVAEVSRLLQPVSPPTDNVGLAASAGKSL